jgi:Ca2+/H+ antiporter, TMEM165/GDT1 family
VVLLIGALMHKPLSRVPENTIKYAVGLLLATFGTFWAAEGLGVFAESQESLEWPGGDWAIPALLALWLAVSQITVGLLRRITSRPAGEMA